MANQTKFYLFFCSLVLAYKRNKPVGNCVEMMGLPPEYARMAVP